MQQKPRGGRLKRLEVTSAKKTADPKTKMGDTSKKDHDGRTSEEVTEEMVAHYHTERVKKKKEKEAAAASKKGAKDSRVIDSASKKTDVTKKADDEKKKKAAAEKRAKTIAAKKDVAKREYEYISALDLLSESPSVLSPSDQIRQQAALQLNLKCQVFAGDPTFRPPGSDVSFVNVIYTDKRKRIPTARYGTHHEVTLFHVI